MSPMHSQRRLPCPMHPAHADMLNYIPHLVRANTQSASPQDKEDKTQVRREFPHTHERQTATTPGDRSRPQAMRMCAGAKPLNTLVSPNRQLMRARRYARGLFQYHKSAHTHTLCCWKPTTRSTTPTHRPADLSIAARCKSRSATPQEHTTRRQMREKKVRHNGR